MPSKGESGSVALASANGNQRQYWCWPVLDQCRSMCWTRDQGRQQWSGAVVSSHQGGEGTPNWSAEGRLSMVSMCIGQCWTREGRNFQCLAQDRRQGCRGEHHVKGKGCTWSVERECEGVLMPLSMVSQSWTRAIPLLIGHQAIQKFTKHHKTGWSAPSSNAE